jgi:hypothetical protein
MKDHHGNDLEKMMRKAVVDLKGSQMVVRRELQVPEGLEGVKLLRRKRRRRRKKKRKKKRRRRRRLRGLENGLMLLRRAMLVGNVGVKGALGRDVSRDLNIYDFYQLVFYIYFNYNNTAQVKEYSNLVRN